MGRLIIEPRGLSYAITVYPATGDDPSEIVLDSEGELVEFPVTVTNTTTYTLPDQGRYRVNAVRHGVECLCAVVNAAQSVRELIPDPVLAVSRAAVLALPLAPIEVEGERDDPESALAALLTALASLGLITDSTEETGA
jgi:hypothetical protein